MEFKACEPALGDRADAQERAEELAGHRAGAVAVAAVGDGEAGAMLKVARDERREQGDGDRLPGDPAFAERLDLAPGGAAGVREAHGRVHGGEALLALGPGGGPGGVGGKLRRYADKTGTRAPRAARGPGCLAGGGPGAGLQVRGTGSIHPSVRCGGLRGASGIDRPPAAEALAQHGARLVGVVEEDVERGRQGRSLERGAFDLGLRPDG